ncbi:MAG: DUF4411 family protein [Magnetococcus sp. DMHC-1]
MKYCLDSNIFIEAWNKHYSPDLAPDYWKMIDQLAKEGVIFATQEVKRELELVDDKLSKWTGLRPHIFKEINRSVQENITLIFQSEKNQRLLQDGKGRSGADPWVIAHAMAEDAVVVTKESYEEKSPTKIRIPNVCENMEVEWIDEFEFLRRIGVTFSVTRG